MRCLGRDRTPNSWVTTRHVSVYATRQCDRLSGLSFHESLTLPGHPSVAVSATHFTLINFFLDYRQRVVQHSSDFSALSPSYMIKIQDDRISLTAVNTGIRQKMISKVFLGNLLSDVFLRLVISAAILPSASIDFSLTRPAPRLSSILSSASRGESVYWPDLLAARALLSCHGGYYSVPPVNDRLVVGHAGFEPANLTAPSRAPYQTWPMSVRWSSRWDSNPRSPRPERGALDAGPLLVGQAPGS
jgi:hypothetical protein